MFIVRMQRVVGRVYSLIVHVNSKIILIVSILRKLWTMEMCSLCVEMNLLATLEAWVCSYNLTRWHGLHRTCLKFILVSGMFCKWARLFKPVFKNSVLWDENLGLSSSREQGKAILTWNTLELLAFYCSDNISCKKC